MFLNVCVGGMQMARVKRGVVSHARHKRILGFAKGFYGRRKNTIRAAKSAVEKSWLYAYRDRKSRKRNFRRLWIQRINASAREHAVTYSSLMCGLNKANVVVNRKILADIAVRRSDVFSGLVEVAKKALRVDTEACV